MRRHAIPASTARPRKALDVRSPGRPSRSHRVSRAVFFGIANDGITKVRRQRSTLSPRKPVSENPAIEEQAFWGQHGAAVVFCEMPLLAVVFQIISTCAVHLSASNGLGLTEDRLRLDRLPATAAANFFPPRVPRFASRSKKAVDGRQALALCPSGAVRSSPVERPPSRSRLARPDWKKEHDNGNHRHLHQDRERLHRHGQDPEPQRQDREVRPRRRATASAAPTSASSPVQRILVQPGRRPPARRSASISRSSWTIRASPRRSMPAWSRPRTARATSSSGPAATAIEARPTKEPRSRAGLRSCSWPRRRSGIRRSGWSDVRFCGLHILIRSFADLRSRSLPDEICLGRCPRRGARDR